MGNSSCLFGRKCWEDSPAKRKGNAAKEEETSFFGGGEEDVESEDEASNDRSYPLVFSGPSGVGKTTIIKELTRRYPTMFGFSVSHTSREPREGEKRDRDYHFTTREQMEKDIKGGKFVEYDEVHGHLYATSKESVHKIAVEGKICVLDIDIHGVRKVKQAHFTPKPRFVFIMPPSDPDDPTQLAILTKRLQGRGDLSEEKLQEALVDAAADIAYAKENNGGNFDAIIVNDNLDTAMSELLGFLGDWSETPLFFQAIGNDKAHFPDSLNKVEAK